jgi:hypothetical protein
MERPAMTTSAFHPGGMIDSSPGFQPWETRTPNTIFSPEGTAEFPRGRRGLKFVLICFALCNLLPDSWTPPSFAATTNSSDLTSVILVVGAPGESDYATNFTHQATLWQKACAQADCHPITIGLETSAPANVPAKISVPDDLTQLKQTLEAEPREGLGPLWLVLIGHGTFDGKEARFNLRGPDVSATDLALWLKPFHRPLAVIDTASASAPFLNKLAGTNRVLIASTRSGYEQNFSRFGQYFAETITSPEADLDKDGQVSLLEAFLTASRKTTEFYKTEGRLATEHALIDDNGDGLGTPADWFRGLRAVKSPKEHASLDGLLASQIHLVPSSDERQLSPAQRNQRDSLERAVLKLRERKAQLPEDDYYRQLEQLLLPLARFYDTPKQ